MELIVFFLYQLKEDVQVFLVGTLRHPDDIDPEVLEYHRLGGHVIEIGIPSSDEKAEV